MKTYIDRRWIMGATAALGLAFAGVAAAQAPAFFRIGTGGTAGTYYPVGGLIANTISGHRRQGRAGPRGYGRGLQRSVANISAVKAGRSEFGFTQSDVAYWAYTGTGLFEGKGKIENLRAHRHPLSRDDPSRGNEKFRHQVGRGSEGQARFPGRARLRHAGRCAHRAGGIGLTEKDVKAEYLKPGPAGDRLRDGALDAYFFVGGYPTGAISELATSIAASRSCRSPARKPKRCWPITSSSPRIRCRPGPTRACRKRQTISVNAQWVTSAKQSDDLVYNIIKALWSDNSRAALNAGHAKGKLITLQNATSGLGIPLHPGAEKFYREEGRASSKQPIPLRGPGRGRLPRYANLECR